MSLSAAYPVPPATVAPTDIATCMARALLHAAVHEQADLGDGRTCHDYLIRKEFAPSAVALHLDDAIEEASNRLQRRNRILDRGGKAADALALTGLVAVWSLTYCLACPPSHAAPATAITPVRIELGVFAAAAPFLIAGVVLLLLFWNLRGRAATTADEPSLLWAPPSVPDTVSLERRARDAEGR